MEEEITIVGFDLSLTATGIATKDGATVYKPGVTVPMIRLATFRNWVKAFIEQQRPSMVVIENYAYGAKFQRETLAELHGVIRLALYDATIPFALVAPTSLKKFATGAGNAGKDNMVGEAARKGCNANDNNAVDAWWLRQMALHKFNLPGAVELPKLQRDVVNKIEWPMRFAA